MRSLVLVLSALLLSICTAYAQPNIQIQPADIDFGRTPIDWDGFRTLTISNDGDERLIFSVEEIDNAVFSTSFRELPEDSGLVHYEFLITDINHSILIREAQWDGEPLPFLSEIGIFDPRGNCSGGTRVEEEGEMVGLAAWGAEDDGEVIGFEQDDEFEFRFWDPATDEEAEAEIEVVQGNDNWQPNGFSLVELSAEGGDHRRAGEEFLEPDGEYELRVYFSPPDEEEHDAALTINSNDPDAEAVEVGLSGSGYENFAPLWVDIVDEIEVIEGDVIDLNFIAEDENDDPIVLTIDPNGLPEDIEFEDHEDGTCHFIWETGDDDAGLYEPVFSASDGFAVTDSTVRIVVRPGSPELPNQTLIEDQDFEVLFDLDEYFGDSLEINYELSNPVQELRIQIDNDNQVTAHPIPDFWLAGPGAEVSVRATYPNDHRVISSFFVQVRPLNDPPGAFNLLSPEDGHTDYFEHGEGLIAFNWSVAEQNEYEADDVHYLFRILELATDSTYSVIVYENMYVLRGSDWLDSLSGGRGPGLEWAVQWFVTAIDDSGASVVASNAPFELYIAVNVDQEPDAGMPTQFQIQSVYPNPFNDQTKVRFGVPAQSKIKLDLWDAHGRKVRRLRLGEGLSPGWHEATITAAGLPAGIYVVKIDNGNVVLNRKVHLVR